MEGWISNSSQNCQKSFRIRLGKPRKTVHSQDPAPEDAALNIVHVIVGTTGEARHTAATKAGTAIEQWQPYFWTLGSAIPDVNNLE